MNDWQEAIVSTEQMMGMRVIAGALIGSTVMLAAIALFVTMGREPGDPLVGYIALGISAVDIMTWAVVPNLIARARVVQVSAGGASLTDRLCGLYRMRMILGMALLEGAAFFNIIAYLITARWWCLAAAGVLLLLMAASFPTRTKVEHWIETQRQLIESRR